MRVHARRAASALVVLLLVSGLCACSSSTESYCGALREDKKQLEKLAGEASQPGSDGLGDTVSLLSGLRDEAPDDIAGEWDTLVGALEELDEAIEASGADPGDFGSDQKPPGVSEGQFDAVQKAAAELGSLRVQQASKSIEQHASDVCKVDLRGGLGGAG